MRTGGRFDVVGAIGMAAGLVCVLLAISKGADRGWTSGTTLGLFTTAVVVLLLWGLFELCVSRNRWDLRPPRPPGAVHQRRLDRRRVRHVHDDADRAAAPALRPATVWAGRCSPPAWWAPMGLVMMATAPVSALLSNGRARRRP